MVSRGGTTSEIEDDEGLLCFPSNDPACTELWPCECQGYGLVDATDAAIMVHISLRRRAVMVDGSTLVRIMPCHAGFGAPLMKSRLVGEVAVSVSEFQERAALAAQNPSTVQELSLRMRRLLSEPTRIGTTVDALEKCRQQKATRLYRERAIRAVFGLRGDEHSSTLGKMPKLVDYVATSTLFREGGLLVHSPEHGAGKTFLVETIARRLGAAVHVIQPGPLLAKYGVHADTALQCTIHAIAMEAAVRRQTVCIVLDSLDAMLPATHSSNTAGDAANPILHGIASYLQTLTTSLQQQRELPFPRNNPLYNLNGTNGAILPVRLCLVAVVTCPDDGRKLAGGDAVTAAMGIYRLPNLTSAARLSAFLWAFSEERIAPSPDLQQKLPFLAAAAVWSRGAVFYRIARQIRARVDSRHGSVTCSQSSKKVTVVVSLEDAEYAFNGDEKSYRSGCDVQFLADRNNMNESIFGVVGGNHEAKAALEDALALDPARRNLLASFGLSPATGILLYGPPGTGAYSREMKQWSWSHSNSPGRLWRSCIRLPHNAILTAVLTMST